MHEQQYNSVQQGVSTHLSAAQRHILQICTTFLSKNLSLSKSKFALYAGIALCSISSIDTSIPLSFSSEILSVECDVVAVGVDDVGACGL